MQHSTSARPIAVAILAAFVLVAPGGAQVAIPDAVRIDNFAKVNEAYFRGAQPTGGDYASLAGLGVKTVINLIGDADLDRAEQSAVEGQGMRYVHLPMTTRTVPTREQLDTFLAIVNDPASQPVYVHCVGGRHRTGVMTAVYRMTKDGLSGEQAFKEMKQFKYGPDFLHPEFKRFVHDYEVQKPIVAGSGS